MIGELKNGNRMTTNLDNLVLKVRKVRFGNKRMVEKQQKELSKYNNRDKNNNKRQLNSERIKTKIGLLPVKQGQ